MAKAPKDLGPIPITTLAGSTFKNFKAITKGRRIDREFKRKFLLSKLVSWIIKEHEARMVYQVQGGLISVVIVGILAICWVSRGKSFRNG